jgi:hypothetical protein
MQRNRTGFAISEGGVAVLANDPVADVIDDDA